MLLFDEFASEERLTENAKIQLARFRLADDDVPPMKRERCTRPVPLSVAAGYKDTIDFAGARTISRDRGNDELFNELAPDLVPHSVDDRALGNRASAVKSLVRHRLHRIIHASGT